MRRFTALLPCAALLLCVRLAAPAAAVERDAEAAARIEAAAGEITMLIERAPADDDAALRELAARLADLPADTRPALLQILRGAVTDPPDSARRRVLDLVFDRLGPAGVRVLMEPFADEDADELERVIVLWLVRERRIPGAMGLALDAVTNADERLRRGPALRSALRSATEVALAHDPAAATEIAARFARLPADLQAMVLDTAADPERGLGSRWTSGLLWPPGRHERLVLERLTALPVTEAVPIAPIARHNLLASFGAPDPRVRRLAATCAARFHVPEAAPALVALLADDDDAVASAALVALGTLTSARLPASTQKWEEFLERERRWMDADAPARLESVAAHDEATALEALRGLGRHRLYGERLWRPVADLLGNGTPRVRRAACETLGLLGVPAALPDLLRGVGDDDPDVADAASLALARVTRIRLPEAPAAWIARLPQPRAR